MQLVILASGRGSRLNRKTKKIPKCLVKLKNKSIIDYNLKFYKKFKKKIIITGYKSHLLKKKLTFCNDTSISSLSIKKIFFPYILSSFKRISSLLTSKLFEIIIFSILKKVFFFFKFDSNLFGL